MLPPPTISFTIPSIHDDRVLQCRIYHPTCLAPTAISHVAEWGKKAAIVAHPYAPLGGCYDDPVVNVVASTILKEGFILGTFNFRGVGSGRTSWSSKAEQEDYISFIGFMTYYMHHLSPPPLPFGKPRFAHSDSEVDDLTPIPSQAIPTSRLVDFNHNYEKSNTSPAAEQEGTKHNQARLLLAGYSYGSLITTLLPPIISSIITPFQNPLPGSAHAEIRMRADCLAVKQNQLMAEHMSSFLNAHFHHRRRSLYSDDILHNPKARKSSGGVRMGGEEDLRRASHESHRSRGSFGIDAPEIVRKSVERVRSMGKNKSASPPRTNTHGSVASSHLSRATGSIPSTEKISPLEVVPLKQVTGIEQGLQTAYLLISPLQGVVGSLATMWSSRPWKASTSIPENERKLAVDPTLALFGNDDIFVSVKKLRAWAKNLTEAGSGSGVSQFRYAEVEGAGHFWHNHRALKILVEEVATFVKDL